MRARTSILRQRRHSLALAVFLLVSAGSTHADDKAPPAGAFFGTFEGHYLDNFGEKTRWGMTSPSNDASLSTANFSLLPKWGGGGRVGLGYRATAGWDVVALGAADWLYSGQQEAFVPSSQFLVNTLGPPLPGIRRPEVGIANLLGFGPSQATADSELAYSYVDLEGGYTLKLGTIIDVRLFGGARYANFDQGIETTGMAGVGSVAATFFALQTDARNQVTYWGVGPRVGASSRLRIFESPFYLVTAVSGSALFGDMRVRERQSTSTGLVNVFNLENTMYTARTAYNGEGEMGVLYDVSPILQGLDVTVGYRVAGWFGVNDTRTSVGPVSGESHANVVTQGSFLRINVRY